jgi:eukaryotic-like serine/threonine-protein kinase
VFKFITHRPLWANILAAVVLTVIIFFIFIFSLKWCTHHNESMSVPSVTGKTISEAEKILEEAGFLVKIQDSIYTDTSKPLMVVKQVPEADELVKVNRIVFLTINRAVPPAVEMPNLVGASNRSAEMILKNVNLKLGKITYKPSFAKDAVLEQLYNGETIVPGTKIKMGSSISLVLGSGIGETSFVVPYLVGKKFCEAKTLLQANGLSFGSIVAIGIKDTCNAYIYRQTPERYKEDRSPNYIRSGQLMDVWLQEEQPEVAPEPQDPAAPTPPTEQ